MSKTSVIVIFIIFIIYTMMNFFVEIPKIINSIFFGIISVLTIYFLIFHLDIGSEIKNRFNKNRADLDKDNILPKK